MSFYHAHAIDVSFFSTLKKPVAMPPRHLNDAYRLGEAMNQLAEELA